MTKPPKITEAQLDHFWLDEFSIGGFCCLCGNKGMIDTRGRVSSPNGIECGAEVFCICPNGRKIKKLVGQGHKLAKSP